MSLTDYVIMPAADYLDACNATREKTGGTDPIKSGQMGGLIRGISGGGEVAKGLCEGTEFDIKSDEVESVQAYAFTYRDNIGPFFVKSIDLPNAKTIGKYAFDRCLHLETAALPSVTDIGEKAFTSCTKLSEVVAPNVTNMGQYAFYNCEVLKSANFAKLGSVPNGALKYCAELETVNIPSAVEVGENAFDGCSKLENIYLPSVTTVGDAAFSNCENLKKVEFGSVVTLGGWVFAASMSLTAVIFRTTEGVCVATPETLTLSPFETGMAFVYIPASMWDLYSAVYGDYIVLFRKIEDYPEICG